MASVPPGGLRCGLDGYNTYLERGEEPPRTTNYRKRLAKGLVVRRKKTKNDENTNDAPALNSQAKNVSDLLYPNSRITKKESIIILINIAQRHPTVNQEIMKDLIWALELHLPKDVNVKHLQSMYKFCKVKEECLKQNKLPTYSHHMCPKCFHLFSKPDEKECPTENCKQTRFKEGSTDPQAAFVELDVESQIKELFLDPSFVGDLGYRFSHPEDDIIRDIYDGELYPRSFSTSRYNLTLMLHTDGVQVYNSNNDQLWPLSAVINELPPWKRFSKRYFLLLGLYYGRHKPEMNTFMSPFIFTLNQLYVDGIDVQLPNGTHVRTHIRSIACTMDLPALASVKAIHQWNGSFGCGMCEIDNKSTASKHGSCTSYIRPAVPAKRRTKESMQEQAVEAMTSGKDVVVKGVKGLSVVVLLKDVDVSTFFLVDYMHGTCLGTVKQLIFSWVHDAQYLVKGQIGKVDARLRAIAPPTSMRRKPLKFGDLANTKASQYRDFLLFYGLHALEGVLPYIFHAHFGLLVRGVYILSQSKITPQDMRIAAQLLDKFYEKMHLYYGPAKCTLNVHNIGTHMVECVRLAGPLFTHSAFFFESICGDIGAMVTGTRNPVKQIIDGVSKMQEFRAATSVTDDFSEEVKMMLKRDRRKMTPMSDHFIHSKQATPVKPHKLEPNERCAVQKYNAELLRMGTSVVNRAERHKMIYENYQKDSKKQYQDCFVSYMHDASVCYGAIHGFYQFTAKSSKCWIALISPFSPHHQCYPFTDSPEWVFKRLETSSDQLAKHISAVKIQESILHAVPLHHIKRKLVFLPKGDGTGAAIELPSSFEHN